jgi:hypothetical protein
LNIDDRIVNPPIMPLPRAPRRAIDIFAVEKPRIALIPQRQCLAENLLNVKPEVSVFP